MSKLQKLRAAMAEKGFDVEIIDWEGKSHFNRDYHPHAVDITGYDFERGKEIEWEK